MPTTALITGASKGIGHAFAELFAQKGYSLVLVARHENLLLELQVSIEENFHVKVIIIPLDLAETHNAAVKIFNRLKKLGVTVDVLINNAGFGLFGKFYETDWHLESNMIRLHVLFLTHITKIYLKEMVSRGQGKILNISSIAAFQPGPQMAVYYATKAYIMSFSQAIANEVKGTGVTITAFCPGPTKTDFQKTIGNETSLLAKMKMVTTPEKVARQGFRAMQKGKAIAIPGFWNRTWSKLIVMLPRNWAASFMSLLLKENRRNSEKQISEKQSSCH